jgi:PucR-like helix-turn-helix protein
MPVSAEVLIDAPLAGLPGDSFAVLTLIRAAVNGEAESFVAAAATLIQGPVMLLDGDGTVLALSPGPGGDGPRNGAATEIVLRDKGRVWGTITVSLGPPGTLCRPRESLLAELGLALVKAVYSERVRATLESQLVVLSCLSGGDAGRALRGDRTVVPEAARRLVVLRAARPLCGHPAARLLDLVRRAAASDDAIPGLCLVPSEGALVGVYPDTGGPASVHKRSWDGVLRSAGDDSVTAAVGAAVTDADDFPGQHRLVRDVAEIQQRGAGIFGLPRVAMLDDLGPLTEVIGGAPGRNLVPFAERVLGELLYDQRFGGQLIETLYAYLQTGGSPREAGELLHLHPSTVKYRMRVIRELLGPRLEDRSARFDMELAVRLCLAARLLRAEATQ